MVLIEQDVAVVRSVGEIVDHRDPTDGRAKGAFEGGIERIVVDDQQVRPTVPHDDGPCRGGVARLISTEPMGMRRVRGRRHVDDRLEQRHGVAACGDERTLMTGMRPADEMHARAASGESIRQH